MSYELLTPRQRQVLDILFSGDACKSTLCFDDAIGRQLGVSRSRVRMLLRTIGSKYGIDGRKYRLTLRLVYLRGRELGLIA